MRAPVYMRVCHASTFAGCSGYVCVGMAELASKGCVCREAKDGVQQMRGVIVGDDVGTSRRPPQGRREVSRRGRESWVGGQELQLLHTILKSANCRRVGHPLPSYGVLIKHTVDHTSIEVASRAFIISLPPIHERGLVRCALSLCERLRKLISGNDPLDITEAPLSLPRPPHPPPTHPSALSLPLYFFLSGSQFPFLDRKVLHTNCPSARMSASLQCLLVCLRVGLPVGAAKQCLCLCPCSPCLTVPLSQSLPLSAALPLVSKKNNSTIPSHPPSLAPFPPLLPPSCPSHPSSPSSMLPN